MKTKVLLGLILGISCTFSAVAKPQQHQLQGIWFEDCDARGKSIVTYNENFRLRMDAKGRKKTGTWRAKNNHLVIKFDDRDRAQNWNIVSLSNEYYVIEKNGSHCMGSREDNRYPPVSY